MPFSIDFLDDGRVLEWDATVHGAVATQRDDYTPRFYVAAREPDADIDLTALQSIYDHHPDVVATEMVARRPGFRPDEEPVLAVHPGQDVEYVVVDDEKFSRERGALAHEEVESYYETELVRAVGSVLAPLGWDREKIRREIVENRGANHGAVTRSKGGSHTVGVLGGVPSKLAMRIQIGFAQPPVRSEM